MSARELLSADDAIKNPVDSLFEGDEFGKAKRLRHTFLPIDVTAGQVREYLGIDKQLQTVVINERDKQYIILVIVHELVEEILKQQKAGLVDEKLLKKTSDMMWLLDNVHYDTTELHLIMGKIYFKEAKKRMADTDAEHITDEEIACIEGFLRAAADGFVQVASCRKEFYLMVTKKRVDRVMGENQLKQNQ